MLKLAISCPVSQDANMAASVLLYCLLRMHNDNKDILIYCVYCVAYCAVYHQIAKGYCPAFLTTCPHCKRVYCGAR